MYKYLVVLPSVHPVYIIATKSTQRQIVCNMVPTLQNDVRRSNMREARKMIQREREREIKNINNICKRMRREDNAGKMKSWKRREREI